MKFSKPHSIFLFLFLIISSFFVSCVEDNSTTPTDTIDTNTVIIKPIVSNKTDIHGQINLINGSFIRTSSTNNKSYTIKLDSLNIDQSEVSQKLYDSIMNDNNFLFISDSLPANVNWYQAILFCNKRSNLSNLDSVYSYDDSSIIETMNITLFNLNCNFNKNGFRLPTEAEWEYASKAGNFLDPWILESNQDSLASLYAWYFGGFYDSSNTISTRQISKLKYNSWFLYDMIGNVSEWCQDNYHIDAYSLVSNYNPYFIDTSFNKVIRGGAYNWNLDTLNSSFRSFENVSTINTSIGFRTVRRNWTKSIIVPSTPTGFTSFARSSQSIKLEWDADNIGSKFEIYYSTDSINYYYLSSVLGTSKIVTNLIPETTYWFKIRTENYGIRSPFSNIHSSKTQTSSNLSANGMLEIPAGSFSMGDSLSPLNDAKPSIEISISRSFNISSHELTRGEFVNIMNKAIDSGLATITEPANFNNFNSAHTDTSLLFPNDINDSIIFNFGDTILVKRDSDKLNDTFAIADTGFWVKDSLEFDKNLFYILTKSFSYSFDTLILLGNKNTLSKSDSIFTFIDTNFSSDSFPIVSFYSTDSNGKSLLIKDTVWSIKDSNLADSNKWSYWDFPNYTLISDSIKDTVKFYFPDSQFCYSVYNTETISSIRETYGPGNNSSIVPIITSSETFKDTLKADENVILQLWENNVGIYFAKDSLRVRDGHKDLPLTQITWYGALYYCNMASIFDSLEIEPAFEFDKNGNITVNEYNFYNGGFRLPTEAEWEYVARAETTTPYYWGGDIYGNISNDDIFDFAWFSENTTSLKPVMQKESNDFGCFDISGNAVELCFDIYDANYYSREENFTDPIGPLLPSSKVVIRGGSYFGGSQTLKSYYRYWIEKDEAFDWVGFRLVRN